LLLIKQVLDKLFRITSYISNPSWIICRTITSNLNVKQPSILDEVNGPGIVVPQYEPGTFPGTFPPLALGISGAGIEFPSKHIKKPK
jgi:hypothetical protein